MIIESLCNMYIDIYIYIYSNSISCNIYNNLLKLYLRILKNTLHTVISNKNN